MLKYIFVFIVGFIPKLAFSQADTDSNYRTTMPLLWAHIGHYGNATREKIEKYSLSVQKGVICGSTMPGISVPCNVTTYEIVIISDNHIVFSLTENSRFFSEKTIEQFKKVKSGDLLIIRNIEATTPRKTQKVPSIVYEVE